jgi:hypothetical protein
MNNPLEILSVLERFLSEPASLTLFGRSAIGLGYPGAAEQYGATLDVHGIIPVGDDAPGEGFWLAQQATNAELHNRGLYITHLFSELDIIIQPDWPARRVPIELNLRKLQVFRPGTIDLVLTKMARGDEQDLDDIRFLLSQERLTVEELSSAFSRARVPEVEEIRELFHAAQPKVLQMAREELERTTGIHSQRRRDEDIPPHQRRRRDEDTPRHL